MFKKLFITLLFIFAMLFSSIVTAREITVAWDANSEPDLAGYKVYWGTESGTYTNDSGLLGLETTYRFTLPDDGLTYYIVVTAIDTSKLESDYSNEVNTKTDPIDEYLYMPPAKPSNLKRAVYQHVLPDGSIAVFQGSSIKVTRPDGTVIEVQQ